MISLQMCISFSFFFLKHDIQVSLEITLKYILINYTFLSAHSAIQFNRISKTIKIIIKLYKDVL